MAGQPHRVVQAVVGLAALTLALGALSASAGSPLKTRLVSKTSAGEPAMASNSRNPSTSASGRYVAFDSGAENLPGGVSTRDVYVHDRKTRETRGVSKTSGGEPTSGGDSSNGSISASGRYVAFNSFATNLPGDASFAADVYVRDRETGKTKLMSKTSDGEPAAGGDSEVPAISASGRYVAFRSTATNLPGNDSVRDIYFHDRKTGRTRLASRTSGGDPATGGDSFDPSISASGRYVAYESSATNLPGEALGDVYVHDRKTAKTGLASRTSGGDPASGGSSSDASISSSGRFVAFASSATNLPGDDSVEDVFVRDRDTGKTKLVSRTSAGEPATGGGSDDPAISGSGRYVSFESDASNLPGAGSDRQIYVHDRKTGKTRLVSKAPGGEAAAGGDSTLPSISALGSYVAFISAATNLPGDDGVEDVFLRGPLR